MNIRSNALAKDITDEVGEHSLRIIRHPEFPRLLARFISDCEDLDDEITVWNEERIERKNQE